MATDAEKSSTDLIARFGQLVDSQIETNPALARRLLLTGFKAERLRTQLLPRRELLPSGQLDNRLTLEGVVGALEHPDRMVLTSMFMPSEIFHAMGLYPVIAEAIGDFFSGAQAEQGFVTAAEQRSVPESYCSYHKVLVGATAAGVIAAPRLIANCSVACDANNLTFKWLARHLDCERRYIDVPYDPSEDAVHYVADELRELASAAQDVFNTKLDQRVLSQHVARSIRALDVMERTLPQRARRTMHTTMTIEMMRSCSMHMMLGTPQVDHLMDLVQQEIPAKTHPYAGLNLLWSHTMPYFSVPLQRAVDNSPLAQIVASEMCFDQFRPGGWRHDAGEPFEHMAERLVYNSYNGPAERRVDRLLHLARTTQADGAIVFCHWGCKETMGASQLIKSSLEEAGFPTLVLDGDGCARRNMPEGQTATRVQAFLEMLQSGRRS
ncbi:MAG: 2-hydroxyacyl-CoA dehydratase [Coriobacteriaceae bacterium]|nr:MAG: 2-hydroxyacyl-CoA dehydratase [Coriobacteriaceae bacterium]